MRRSSDEARHQVEASWGDPARAGAQVDGDVELPNNLRLLYGAEGLHEWVLNDVTEARGSNGVQSEFVGPYEIARLPFSCPIRRVLDENGNPTGSTESD